MGAFRTFPALTFASLILASASLGDVISGSVQRVVDEATIVLLPARCAGVIVGDRHTAITAAHCLGNERFVDVRLFDGKEVRATIERVDREIDVAVLHFDDDASVRPLTLASRMPSPGEALYFGGRADRRGSDQVFAVVNVGRCPSLPQVEEAIFTNLRARKGDSGAPLVNKHLEIVGLVHGGAGCNIAAPVVGIASDLGLSTGSGESCAWGHC
jgi:S1-C subfamily serine protease